ncbi:RHS repeat domain-containing protein [Dyadobacter sandarakinus]|uniref:Teneurin-like YD-shell domain-containing protein n=1 Tax=Dyadobacter sandarakinus TaxID=2747268 RepID=A0ABX7IBS0_9BACT|nr:RHS repeat-associated core domain-containing protein [Dyadobacter sandarakinus]QRR02376.1 hypothetical protein HWI92_16395 [Dyadobacter sandarakinus]
MQPAYQDVASLTDHAFTYDYDERQRLIVKRVPGQGATELVYDQYDRLALSRDPGQLGRGVWGFTKYDALDRPIASGEITSSATRTDWSVIVDALTQHHEERANAGIAGYTLDKTAPKTASEADLLSITFYDDYQFSKAAGLAYTPVYYPACNPAVKGQLTGSRTRMLSGSGNLGSWLTAVTYYDTEYRPIQVSRELYELGAGAVERASTQYKYDLAPIAAQQKTEQLLSGNIVNTHLASYTYDHADRLLDVKEKVTAGAGTAEAYTTAQRYNALGQLQSKWLHSTDGIHYLRKTNYTHNIRGWLSEGKTVYKKNENGPELPYFGFGLTYQKANTYTNGNISQMQWANPDEASFTKGLTFTYDGANRLTGSTGINGYADTESSITYDKNGNIKTLNRAGAATDNLAYTYTGNRLSAVSDNSASNTGVKSGSSTFAYDLNGNMTSDGTRGAALTYNQVDQPKSVTIAGKTQVYDYDASGEKHKYAADTITLKYAGAFEYRQVGANNNFYRLSLSEGQAVMRNGKLVFEYYLKDHLGNVRVVFDQKGNVLQRTDYYPFGLEIDRKNPVQMPAVRNAINRYNFLGRENQVGTGYIDLVRRFYDPTIGRFIQIDPVIETQEHLSVYQYGWNNPILRSDPNGDMPECCGGIGDFLTGVGQAINENMGWGNPMTAQPGYVDSYNAGRTVGHYASIVIGATGVAGGAAGIAASGGIVGGSGGAAIPVAAVVATGSAGLAALGNKVAVSAIDNLKNDKGRINANAYSDRTDKQLQSSKSSYEKLITEHKQKLNDFKSDPLGKSDPNKLKEAMKGGADAVKKFLQGRVESLNKQIKKQEGELNKINQEIDRRNQ